MNNGAQDRAEELVLRIRRANAAKERNHLVSFSTPSLGHLASADTIT